VFKRLCGELSAKIGETKMVKMKQKKIKLPSIYKEKEKLSNKQFRELLARMMLEWRMTAFSPPYRPV